jgi:uncharacterized protein YpbB
MDYLQHEMGFGGIFWHDIATIVGFIEQLENMELLRRKQMPEFGSYVEILELTEGGKKVLDENINIELQIIKKEKPLIIGETERQTLGLLKSGKTIEEISKERTLAVSTIYDHLHTLTVKKAISLSEFIPQ